ncbi:unnamed protein product [Rotaria sp. Silwood1]|nr:unnamed protein product [Rotaria sp. Silwood1]
MILQRWLPCICCTSLYPESQFKNAVKQHELYHDVVEGQLLCRKCIEFTPSNNYPYCRFARYKNKLEITSIPENLVLGFIEQRAITLSHIYMSIILIRGRQAALKGQVVHFHVDTSVIVDDLLPFPRCYEFLAVVQEKPLKNNEIRTTVSYSFSPVQVLKALNYLKQHNHLYSDKKLMTIEEIQEIFKCRQEDIIPIRIIDSYAYNNATTIAPVINSSEPLFGPKRIIPCAQDPIWEIEPYLEERCYPWLYPHGKGGEADPERPLQINLRDYYKQRLKSADNRWQKDPTWIFRALNLLQREDLCRSVNYHVKKSYQNGKMCYLIYPGKLIANSRTEKYVGMVIRGSSAFWDKARRHLRSMYATLGKPFIFLSINLQDDVEFLTNINPEKFGSTCNPNWEAIDSLSDDEYLMLVNENPALVARMCKRRLAGFEEYISDKKHPFLIDYIVSHYFLKTEFQRDGLPHLHALLWIENPPSTDTTEGRQEILAFVDKFLTTELPDRDAQPVLYKLVRKKQWHTHTFTCSKPIIRIRRGKKKLTHEQKHEIQDNTDYISSINRNNEDEIYEKIDPDDDPDLIQTKVERREFFERARCRFGKPDPLATNTHFRTHKEARILTRGDRDIIMKRTTEESRRIVPYNINLLKTFKCNHDIQIVTDPWAAAEYLFSYISKEAHMEKDLVQKLAGCACSTLEEARKVLLKAGNAVLSHRQIGKIEAAWLILGIPLYRCSMATVHLYISLPSHEDRILKNPNVNMESITEDDFVTTIIHRYSQRPSVPEVINNLTLFEFAVWFATDYTDSTCEDINNNTLIPNPLWRTNYDQPPLLKTSRRLSRIILTSGQKMRQHENPKCVTFTCLHDHTAQSIYTLLCLNIPFRDSVVEFLGGKQEPEIYDLHQVLLQHKIEISTRILTLPQTYRVQLKNLLDHLININKENFKINHRESYIFTNPIEHEDDTIDKPSTDNDLTQAFITTDNNSFTNFDTSTCLSFQALSDLTNTANPQQKYVLDFIQMYLNHLLMHSRRPTHVQKPKSFHIVVNGLAGSGKSYVISIIEKMLNEYCIAESAGVSRARKNFGLLKMAHTGKAALNIHGSTIHSALEICPDGSSSPNKLNSFKFHTLRNKLNGLLLIIIDEISLVSHALFQKINKRLNEIFRTLDKCDVYFGGIPVIVFGDMAQIEPVAAKQVFYRPLGELFSLWHDLFRPINFDINMRQGDDRLFFDCCLDEDTEYLIKSRSIRQQDNPESYQERLKELNSPDFQDAVHAYGVRKLTNLRNVEKLKKHASASKNPIFMINAVDRVAMINTSFFNSSKTSNRTCKINLKPSPDENKCGSLYRRLPICVGARVIIRRNIDQDNSVINGSDAIIKNIVWEDSTDFLLPPAESEDIFSGLSNVINAKLPKYVELELFNGQTYKLEPQETRFNDMNNISMTRVQLPLALGYAITIHRTQCMTYSKLVIDLAGKYWKPDGLKEIERLQRIERENPIKFDDYLNEAHSISDPNRSYTSNVNNKEKKNKTSQNNSKHTNKRLKVINNININNATNVDDDTNMVDDIIKPEDVIICEKQRLLFCGGHALRALVQDRQIFHDTYLISLAEELATQELILRPHVTTVRQYYFNYITGYYHIQVIQKALQQQYNIELLQLREKDETSYLHRDLIRNHIHDVQGNIRIWFTNQR